MPARASLTLGGLPIGLAPGVTLKKSIQTGAPLTWSDMAIVRQRCDALQAGEGKYVQRKIDGVLVRSRSW
jgi:predicted homoserine dehydrogenase-like protein